MWPHVYVICVCLVFLFVGDLLVKKKGLIFATKAIFTAVFLHIVKWYENSSLIILHKNLHFVIPVFCYNLSNPGDTFEP